MNSYVYPLIFESLKQNKYIFLIVHSKDIIHIIKQNGKIYVKKNNISVIYENNFEFYLSNQIDSVMILYDQYGPSYKIIYEKIAFQAAILIQRVWKRYISLKNTPVVSGTFIKMRNIDSVKILKKK